MANELQSRGMWKWGNFSFRDVSVGPAEGHSLMQYVPYPARLDPSVANFWIEDFEYFPATKASPANGWSVTEDDGATGTDAVQESIGGWYRHYCDGDDNDEAYVHRTLEQFKLQANKYLWFEARVKLTESATNKANFIVGLSEAVGANHMQNDGAGPPASYDGIVFYKVDGTMAIGFETSLAAAQVTTASVLTHVSAHVYRLGAICKPTSATTFNVYPFYVDETAGGTPALGTPHALTLTGHGEMEAFFGVKAGSGAEEYIEIDYFWVCQQR